MDDSLKKLIKEQSKDDTDHIAPEKIAKGRSIVSVDPRFLDSMTEMVEEKW